MSNIRTIKLTDAQLSAIVCSGILDTAFDDRSVDEDILRLSIAGTKLVVSPNTRKSIERAINDLSNQEDAFARSLASKESSSFLAARASRALSNLFVKVSRLTFEEVLS